MSIDSLINQYAASDPQVANAVTTEATNSALLEGTLSGDTATTNLLGALYEKETESAVLLNSASAVTSGTNSAQSSGIGGHVDLQA